MCDRSRIMFSVRIALQQFAAQVGQRAERFGAAAVAGFGPGRADDAQPARVPFLDLLRLEDRIGPFHQQHDPEKVFSGFFIVLPRIQHACRDRPAS